MNKRFTVIYWAEKQTNKIKKTRKKLNKKVTLSKLEIENVT